MATPNSMNLNLPIPEETPGPAWAQQLNDQLYQQVAEHDHTSGKGVPVTQEGINITGDLPVNSQNITQARSLRFANQTSGSVDGLLDIGCVYEAGGNLFFNDGDGNVIPITANGALAATSFGGINGLPAGTAAATFNQDTFTWTKATNQYANMDNASVKIRSGNEINPLYGATLKVPDGMAANYDLTLPIAPPATTQFLQMASNGTMTPSGVDVSLGITAANLATNAVTTAKITDGNVTRTKLSPLSNTTASTTAIFNFNSTTTYQAVTGLSLNVTVVAGRPVVVQFFSSLTASTPSFYASEGGGYELRGNNNSISPLGMDLRLKAVNGATTLYSNYNNIAANPADTTNRASAPTVLPANSYGGMIFGLTPGTWTISLEGKQGNQTTVYSCGVRAYTAMYAYELA